MRRILGAATAAAAALAMGAAAVGQPIILPERVEVPKPAIGRKERKRRDRSLTGGHKRRGKHEPLAHILHERGDGNRPLCKPAAQFDISADTRLHVPQPSDPDRIAVGRPVSCNTCQRGATKPKARRNKKAARRNGRRFERQEPSRRPTFAVPARPVRSTRAERAADHRTKMMRKGH